MSRRNRRRQSPGRLDPSELGEVLLRADELGVSPRATRDPWKLSTVGGYRLVREIGRGGSGRVFLARQPGSTTPVAVKILDPWLAHEREFLTRFKREAEATASLNNDSCVGVLDYGRDATNGLYFIVFEYVSGGTLRDLLERDGKLEERHALTIALGLARALEALDSVGILHRDVKPANVLLTASGTPKLADLGLARQQGLSRLTLPGFVMGTPSYLAPELITENDVDVRLDLFALGLTLWEMLTGELPMESNTTGRLIPKHCARDIPDIRLQRPEVSDPTAQVVRGLTARLRGDRYSSPGAAILDLERVLRGDLPLGPLQTQSLMRMRSGEWNHAFRLTESNQDLACLRSEPVALSTRPPECPPTPPTWEEAVIEAAWPEQQPRRVRWGTRTTALVATLAAAVVGGALLWATSHPQAAESERRSPTALHGVAHPAQSG